MTKRRIYKRYRTRKKGGQRYWVGRKTKKNYGSITKRKWDDRYPEVDLICPQCGTKNWAGVSKIKGKGTLAQCGTCGYVDRANRFVHSRIKKLESKNFGSIRGLTIPELFSKATKITDMGSKELEKNPPIFNIVEQSKGIEKKKYAISGHAMTILKSRLDKEKILTSKSGDKFVTIASNPHTMIGFESDTEEEAKKVHKKLEEEAEDRIT